MERVYCFDAFRRCGVITEKEEQVNVQQDGSNGTSISDIVGRHKRFCSYLQKQWEDTLAYHRPISALLLSNGAVVVVRRLGRELRKSVIGATVTFNDNEGEHILGGWWCPIDIHVRNEEDLIPLQSSNLVGFSELLLLPNAPLDDQTRRADTLYHCITNEWTERTATNVYKIPNFSKAIY
jgi:hypothetical protein